MTINYDELYEQLKAVQKQMCRGVITREEYLAKLTDLTANLTDHQRVELLDTLLYWTSQI